MAEVKWIKITTDMFDNRKIKHLRKLPEGNNIVLIWVMLLTMAGRCNAGGWIYLTESIPYTEEMLSNELDFERATIHLALKTLTELGMIQTDNNGFLAITGWEEHQNVDRLTEIREYNRLAKQKQREKQKLLKEVNDMSMTSQSSQDTDIDKDIDKDIEEDKEIYISVIKYLNGKAGTGYKASSAKSKSCIHARIAEGFTIEDFYTVIDKKCAEWVGTEWEKYLRPETLFGTKFEGYLNQRKVSDGRNTEHTSEHNAPHQVFGTDL